MRQTRSRLSRRLRVVAHRYRRKIEGRAPDVGKWISSWGVSLGLHLGLVVLMALVYFTQPQDDARNDLSGETLAMAPLGEDLTSLSKADQAGDPLTTSTSREFPSLGIDRDDTRSTFTAQPRAPVGAGLGPSFRPATALLSPGVRLTDTIKSGPPGMHVEDLSAPFSGRDGLMKAKLIRRQGGTVDSEKAVAAGLEWLARHQRPDGSWSLDYHAQCQGTGCPPDASVASDMAATGLAILPMLGAGHSHTKDGRYSETIRRGMTWIVKQQDRDGCLFPGGSFDARMYTHAIATMALCEAYGISKDPKLKVPAQRALNYIAKVQNTENGGWRYSPGQYGDTSVFGWQIFALRSGRLAGLSTPKNVVKGCHTYLNLAQTDDTGVLYSYLPRGRFSTVMTAEGLLCRQYLGWPKNHPALRRGAEIVANDLRESDTRNIYYWYYATQLLHNMQDKDWKEWNVRVRDGLTNMQTAGTGCDRGSWDPYAPQTDLWGRKAGRLFTTSLSLLTLEVYYRFLPLYRIPGGEEDDPELGTPAVALPSTNPKPDVNE